jgi:hypothetical protein
VKATSATAINRTYTLADSFQDRIDFPLVRWITIIQDFSYHQVAGYGCPNHLIRTSNERFSWFSSFRATAASFSSIKLWGLWIFVQPGVRGKLSGRSTSRCASATVVNHICILDRAAIRLDHRACLPGKPGHKFGCEHLDYMSFCRNL